MEVASMTSVPIHVTVGEVSLEQTAR
ncbi:hypothetical protein LUU34_00369200 [Aix galericulata]|nr:hypothetical protein LUU34_00369200 [Aix galericulata]